MQEADNDSHDIAALLLYTAAGEVVLQRRDMQAPTSPGKLCLFGGHIKQGESPEVAVRREIGEEIAAKVEPKFLTRFENYIEPDGANVRMNFTVFTAELHEHHFAVYEGKGAEWIPYTKVSNYPDIITGTRDAIDLFLKEKQ